MFSVILLIIFNVLLESKLGFADTPVSPCPNVFHYEKMPQPPDSPYKKTIGVITVPPSPPISLKVSLRLQNIALQMKYDGKLKLAEKEADIAQKFASGTLDRITYHIYYRKKLPIPLVTLIVVNNQILCSYQPEATEFFTNIEYNHVLSIDSLGGKPLTGNNHNYNSHMGNEFKPDGNQLIYPNKPEEQLPEITSVVDIIINQGNSESLGNGEFKPNYTIIIEKDTNPPPSFIEPTTSNPKNTFVPVKTEPTTKKPSNPYPDNIFLNNYQNHLLNKQEKSTQKPPTSITNASLKDTCGKVIKTLPLIVGGEPAKREWPWMVPLFRKTELGVEYICSATLISDQFIVTAAHCVQLDAKHSLKSNDLVAFVGRFNIKYWGEDAWQSREISEVIIHPDYSTTTKRSDVALLKLDRKVTYMSYVNPACIWTKDEDLNMIVGKRGVAFGWGRDEAGHSTTDKPKLIAMPIVSQEECLHSHPDFVFYTSNRTLCAGYRNGTGPCLGDSGGGLLIPWRDNTGEVRWYLRALISLSLGKTDPRRVCHLEEYIIFTDLAKYKDWMLEYISDQ